MAQPDSARRARTEQHKGKLKIFFGFAPGVGEDVRDAGSRARQTSRRVDVVAGWVETHHRPETDALMEGFERISPASLDDDGILNHELDREAAIATDCDLEARVLCPPARVDRARDC